MFCLRIIVLPPPRGRVQAVAPVARSSAHSAMASPSATFRKIRPPERIGVDPLRSGRARFQAMFSAVVHRRGRPFSALTPLRAGPRQWGQSSADDPAPAPASKPAPTRNAPLRIIRTGSPFVPPPTFYLLSQGGRGPPLGKMIVTMRLISLSGAAVVTLAVFALPS